MNKTVKTILAAVLALAVATPALAEFKVSGFYRLMGYSNELKNSKYPDGDSQAWVDQRMRAQLVNNLNDNVSITYQAEIDIPWGTDNASTAGNDGAFDGDGVNVETKHLYLDLKSGDTTARLGLQGVADQFEGMVVLGDMTGGVVNHKINNTSFSLVYAKWDENNGTQSTNVVSAGRSNWDDTDFYAVTVNQKFNDNFKAGAAVYYLDANDVTDLRANLSGTTASIAFANGVEGMDRVADPDRADAEIFFYGLNGEVKFGSFAINGFVLYQEGEVKYNNNVSPDKKNQDSSALAASVKGMMKLDNGNVGLRAIYISEDDDKKDNGYWMGSFGEYDFVNENQMIFLTDKFVCNAWKERYAMDDAASAGFGLLAFVLSGNHNLPSNMYLNWGAGYYMAVDEERNDPTAPKPAKGVSVNGSDYRRGDTLGYELSARIGKRFFEKVDVSLNAAFADFGDFYDDTVVDVNKNNKVSDPDSIYKAYLMVNVPF